jgi:hypothetical protein
MFNETKKANFITKNRKIFQQEVKNQHIQNKNGKTIIEMHMNMKKKLAEPRATKSVLQG